MKIRKNKTNLKKIIKNNKKSIFLAILALILVLSVGRGGLYLMHKHAVDEVFTDKMPYSILGVDVSHYQGDIDWKTLKKQNISFAFIKATEGEAFVDDKFDYNWRHANSALIKRGAYHFFSFDADPEAQAKNFIHTVPKRKNALPPVVDFETYGKYNDNPPSPSYLVPRLEAYINAIEHHYKVQPIIYCNKYCYNKYIRDNFSNPIWLANPSMSPTLPDGKQWHFLQYSFYGQLEGYNGIKHIDLNVYYGTKEQFWDEYY